MRTVVFIPPLSSMTGGLAMLYSLAEVLRSAEHDISLTSPSADACGLTAAQTQGMPVVPWEQLALAPDDCWLMPEGWPQALVTGAKANARTLVYAQSWSGLLPMLPGNMPWNQMPVHFITVSQPVRWFVENIVGMPVHAVVPAAVAPHFYQEGNRPSGHIRVAVLPRKNRGIAEQIQRITEMSLAGTPQAPHIEWVQVYHLPSHEVAAALASCHILLSTGFPEGFSLPPLEAMASGCIPVGCTGFGGWEYMRQGDAALLGLPGHVLAPPPNNLEMEGHTAPNGFFLADGDIIGTGLALAAAAALCRNQPEQWCTLQDNARATALRYTQERRAAAILACWDKIAQHGALPRNMS